MGKRVFIMAVCLFALCIIAHSEQVYQNDTCRFSFVVPDNCEVIEELSDENSADINVFDTKNRTYVANIYYRNTFEKGKILDYRKMRKSILENNDSITLINEKPFYDLLRQDLQYISVLEDGRKIYSKVLIKASSYIRISCYYPLSQEAQQIVDSFDNKTTFRGNLARVKQNAGSILMCIYLSLLCFVGYRARNKELRWLYVLASIILLALPVLCIWNNVQVMLFVVAISLCIWLFFFSHNKLLMWLIDSIF